MSIITMDHPLRNVSYDSLNSWLQSATEEEVSWLESQVQSIEWQEETERAKASLAEFTRQAWGIIRPGTPLIWEPHLDAICQHLEAVSRGQIKNLLITLPPGCTKSILCGVMWPAWTWISFPWLQWLSGSNEGSLANRDAVTCRDLMRSDWYQERWGHVWQFADDQNAKTLYKNNQQGHRWTITTNGNVTGKKGDILLLDDPNDAQRVESETERLNVNHWLDYVWYDRVNDYREGRRVVIGQRTAEKDAIGHLKSNGGWEELCLPEEFEPSRRYVTSLGWTDWRQKAGELLRPDRYGPEQVAAAKARLKSKYFAQHQQNPTATEGERFQRKWFRYYQRHEHHYIVMGDKKYHEDTLHDRFLTVDQATTAKQVAKDDPDSTVISAWAYTPCGCLVWLGCWIEQIEMPDIPPLVGRAYVKYRATAAVVEGGGPQKGGVQLVRRHQIRPGVFMNVVEFLPGTQDLLSRSADAMSMMEAGRVWMPENDPLFPLGEVEKQLLLFTGDDNGAHDDVVSSLAMAARRKAGKVDQAGGTRPKVMPLARGAV